MFPRKDRWLSFFMLLTASLVLAACGGGGGDVSGRTCDDGLEGETITFYSQAGLTGPLSTILGTSFVNSLNDAIDDVNASGGICGATIELILNDTQYDPEQEIAIYSQTREADPVPMFIWTYGSGASVALKDMVIEDKIVNVAAGLNAQAFYVPRNGYTVGVASIYSDQFAGFLQFTKDNWSDIKPEGAGDEIVVGVIGWEGPFGAGATTPEALAYAESIGVTVLELETYEVSAETDVVTPLQSLASQGANVIWIQSLGFGTAQGIGTLRALDMWDSVVVGVVNWGMNQDVLNVLGENAAAMNGTYGVMPYLYWNDTDNEGIQKAIAAFDAGGYPESDRGVSYLMSFENVFTSVQIVERAINNVGFENLNGEAYMEAMKQLHDEGNFSAYGIMNLDARGENRSPARAQIRQAQVGADGKVEFVVVEDFFDLPDTRPSAE